MARVHQHLFHRPHLDEVATEHDGDPVAHIIGRRQVVGNVQDANPQIIPQLLEQVDDRHAQRGIHHRDRFIRDDQPGARQQRSRDGNALELAAGELTGVFTGKLRIGQPDLTKGLVDPCDGGLLIFCQLVIGDRLKEITVHRAQRVKGRERVLKNRLDTLGLPHLFVGLLHLSFIRNRSGGLLFKPQHNLRRGRFSAAAFSRQGKDLRRFDIE